MSHRRYEGKVVLRELTAGDWWQVARWEEDEEVLALIGKKRLSAVSWHDLGRRRRAMGIHADGERLVGYVELREINWRARSGELRICIGDKDYWGRGYGTLALQAFLEICFERFHLEYLYLRVYRSNTRAIRCYRKCGFQVEGVLRGGRTEEDILLMGRRSRASRAGA